MTMACHTVGHGPRKIIALHGWLSDQGVYDHLMPLFDENIYTIAHADYRGYGKSRAQSGEYSIDEIASDALALSEQLGWMRYHMIGHSMAGMVIQKVALARPKALISGTCITPVPASGVTVDADTAAFFRSAADDDGALVEIFNVLTGKRHAASFLNWLAARTRAVTTRDAFLGYLSAWTETDFAADVSAVTAPIHVIAGAHDGALGPDVMADTYMKQLKTATLSVIDSAGHYPMFEAPAELLAKIEGFLDEQDKS